MSEIIDLTDHAVEAVPIEASPAVLVTDRALLAHWRVNAIAAHQAHGDRSPHWVVTIDPQGLINVRLWLGRPQLRATGTVFTLFTRGEVAGLLPPYLARLPRADPGRPELIEIWF